MLRNILKISLQVCVVLEKLKITLENKLSVSFEFSIKLQYYLLRAEENKPVYDNSGEPHDLSFKWGST